MEEMVRPERFELPTYSSGGCRSIQLSYGRVTLVYIGNGDCFPVDQLKSQQPRANLSPSAVAAVPAIATATAPTTGALGLGTSLVHVDGAASDLCSVQSSDGLLTFFGICHFHKSETARPPGLAIGENTHSIHLSVTFEKLAQFILGGIETEISNENVFHVAPLSANRGQHCSKQNAVLPGFANARRV